MIYVKFALIAIIGYLLGSISPAYFIGKFAKGIDIRKKGSGNLGSTNVMRVLGAKSAAVTFVCDVLKGFLTMWISDLLFVDIHAGYGAVAMMIGGITVILGHNFPFYLGFKGGKGIACTAGLVIFFHPYMLIPQVITFFGIFFATHYVSLGSLVVEIVLIAEMVIFGQMGVWGMEQAALNELYLVTVLLAALAFWGHRANIKRLLHKEERKTYLSKKSEE